MDSIENENVENKIVEKLKQANVYAKNVADDFMRNNATNDTELNNQLTCLILNSCNIYISIPRNLINENKCDDIIKILNEKLDSIDSNIENSFSKLWKNLVTFFAHIISSNWSYFSNHGKFDSYFCVLVEKLCKTKLQFLRRICTTIRLKFITGFLKNRILFQEHHDAVQNYAHLIMFSVLYDKYRQIWQDSLNELQSWFELEEKFIDAKFLRYIVWSLKDKTSRRVIITALKISFELLENKDMHKFLDLFVTKIFNIFTELVELSRNNNIFEYVCKCCKLLYLHFRYVLTQDFIKQILDNLFVTDRKRAKTAAQFWIATFDKNYLASIHTVIEFISYSSPHHVKSLVISLIDNYKLITNWSQLAKLLTGTQLTVQEKSVLISLVLFSIQQSITVRHPTKNRKVRQKITSIFAPILDKILVLEYPNKYFTQMLLLKIISLFDFKLVESLQLTRFIEICSSVFENTLYVPLLKVSLKVLLEIEKSTKSSCTFILRLKSNCQDRFAKLTRDILQNPEKYEQNMEAQLAASQTVVRIHCLSFALPLDTKYAFDLPMEILNNPVPLRNSIFFLIQEISIYLSYKYNLRNVERNKQEMCSLVALLSEKLRVYISNRLGETIFLTLCNIAIILAKNKLSAADLEEIFSELVKDKMSAYIGITICNYANSNISPVTTNDVRKTTIVNNYLEVIEQDVLSLTYAYDLLSYFLANGNVIENPILPFLKRICNDKKKKLVAKWILELLIAEFESTSSDVDPHFNGAIVLSRNLCGLLYSIKSSVQHVLLSIHTVGIDYSISEIADSMLAVNFLFVLAELTKCLDKPNKVKITKYFQAKKSVNADATTHYLNSLKKTRMNLSGYNITESPRDNRTPENESNDSLSSHFDQRANNEQEYEESSIGSYFIPAAASTPSLPYNFNFF